MPDARLIILFPIETLPQLAVEREEPRTMVGPGPYRLLFILIALFAGAVLFVIPNFSKYHGDERFYTDAALQMCGTGDYWTPRYASGKIRLLKPIMTYWATAASFKTLGVSLMASRVPSLCAGIVSLGLVFMLGKVVFRSSLVGVLALGMLASNIEFLTLTARATPDALVTMFSLASMTGFALAWFSEKPGFRAALLAWGGMGLAVQTKGFLGLCPLAANLIFFVLARPDDARSRLRALLDWRAIAIGLVLAGFWYVAMVRAHGVSALRDFVDDQVAAKVSLSIGFILANFFSYVGAGLRHFLPWTLICAAGAIWFRAELLEFWRLHRRHCIFLLVLFPLLVVVFSFGNMRTSRYVMISYPALAVLLAAAIHTFWPNPRLQLAIGRAAVALSVLSAALGLALIVAGAFLSWRLSAVGALLIAAGVTGVWLSLQRRSIETWAWIAAICICFYAMFDGAVRPLSTPAPFTAIADRISQKFPGADTVRTYDVEETAASQLRLAAKGKLKVRPASRADLSVPQYVVLTTAAGKNAQALSSYAFEQVTLKPDEQKIRDSLRRFQRKDKGRNTGGRNTVYFVGAPSNPEVPALDPTRQ